jgi:hypothetical protein
MKTNLANFPFPNRPKDDYSIRLLTDTKLAVLNDICTVQLNLFAEFPILACEYINYDC